MLRRTMQSMKRLSRGNYKVMEYLILYRCGEKAERGTELERSLGGADQLASLGLQLPVVENGCVGTGYGSRDCLERGLARGGFCPLLIHVPLTGITEFKDPDGFLRNDGLASQIISFSFLLSFLFSLCFRLCLAFA